MRILASLILGVIGFTAYQAPLFATTSQTGTLVGNATVPNSCVIDSTQNIALGNYLPSSGVGLQANAQMKLTCTKGVVVSVAPVSGGSTLQGGGGALQYGLYTDAAFSKPWGTGFNFLNIDFAVHDYTVAWGNMIGSQTLQQCQTLSKGGPYESTASKTTTGTCWYNLLGPPYTGAVYGQYADYQNLNLNGANVITGRQQWTIYATGSHVSGSVYSLQLSTTNQNPITATSIGVTTPVVLTYYAKVPASQDVPPGMYLDTVTVQVSF